MLSWAAAAFDVLGMQNDRGNVALAAIQDMRSFIKDQAGPDRLKPGSWTARIVELANAGTIDPDLAPFAIRDYINPSLDTTISATGQLIYQLGRSPDQWERLKQAPELVLNAVNEAVRLGTPIRSFSRHTTKEVAIDGVAIHAGARVMMLFAAANRDERAFPDPDRFDISRSPKRHLDDGPQDQRLNVERIIRKAPSGTHLYLCGPKGFTAMVKDCAMKFGQARTRLEHFSAEIDADGESFTVITARSG